MTDHATKSDLESLGTLIMSKIEGQSDLIKSKIGDIEADVADHKETLYGSNGTPGIKTRVDRIYTAATVIKWVSGGITASFGLLVGWLKFKS